MCVRTSACPACWVRRVVGNARETLPLNYTPLTFLWAPAGLKAACVALPRGWLKRSSSPNAIQQLVSTRCMHTAVPGPLHAAVLGSLTPWVRREGAPLPNTG